MKRLTDRRTILLAATTAALAAVATPGSAQASDIPGTVEYDGGVVIPKGEIVITVEDPAIQDKTALRASATRLKSDGGAKAISFTLPGEAAAARASTTMQIVARLEREDGWLLARGSTSIQPGEPVTVTLFTAMY